MKCPRCNFSDVEKVDYLGVDCIVCRKCGYDETKHYDVVAEQKTSQKQKGRHSPYRTGGPSRAKK